MVEFKVSPCVGFLSFCQLSRVTRKLTRQLPNSRSLASCSRISCADHQYPHSMLAIEGSAILPTPHCISHQMQNLPESRLFLNQLLTVRSCEKNQVQSCRAMICFSCKRRKTAASRRMRKCTEKERNRIVSMTRESWAQSLRIQDAISRQVNEAHQLHQSSLQIKVIDGTQLRT